MLNKVYIFDLDDTILECNANYCKTIAKFVLMMVDEFDTNVPHPTDITRVHSTIDKGLIKEQSFIKDRFPLSFVKTYKHFHDIHYPYEDYNEKFMDELMKLGYSIFDIIPRELPNAYNLLSRLQKNNIPIYMLTAGDYEPQRYKINTTRIKDFFKDENVFINPKKGVSEFEEVVNQIKIDHPTVSKKDIIMVGDSLRNDIQPAIQFGINAIHLDVPSWSYNHIEVEGNYHVLNDLYELEDYIFNS